MYGLTEVFYAFSILVACIAIHEIAKKKAFKYATLPCKKMYDMHNMLSIAGLLAISTLLLKEANLLEPLPVPEITLKLGVYAICIYSVHIICRAISLLFINRQKAY